MSDVPQGPGWWQASDGRWYPPTAFPGPAPASPPPGGYGVPVTPPLPRTEPLAVWSLVCGVAGIPLACLCYIGLPALVAAIPLGIVSLSRIGASQGTLTGKGLAIGGIVSAALGLALLIGLFALSVWSTTWEWPGSTM